MDQIMRDDRIPDALKCRVPSLDETVISARADKTAFYPYFFKLGVMLHLHPFFYYSLLSVVVLSHLSGADLDL